MAREWRPSPTHDLMRDDESGLATLTDESWSASRNWAATRGAVLWEGQVDLAGSFPGFAQWGSRAQGVHLTLTDRFLMVNETTEYGFGLPIGWLSAAHALTGVESIALETGDRLRVCYVDGSRVRGFTVRVRGGRFGGRTGRRANQLRAAALSLGLASTAASTDLLLPPEHDLALDWNDFASYEAEPVVWTGRATMPIGNGLELASSDVWLTDASLIWGARSRAGIYRIAMSSIAAVTAAETPAHETVIFWSVSGSHRTVVDVPMVLTRHDLARQSASPLESLLGVLEDQGHSVAAPAGMPQPWSVPVDSVYAVTQLVALTPAETHGPDETAEALDPATGQDAVGGPAGPAPERPGPIRRRLLDDGLFPERLPTPLPTSTPRPWGNRVERVTDEGSGDPVMTGTPQQEQRPVADATVPSGEPMADRLRLWPSATPRRQAPVNADPSAMLVRRPPVRATTTEEFLASEQAARDAARRTRESAEREQVTTSTSSASSGTGTSSDRGVMVRFRPADAIAGLKDEVRTASDTAAAWSTSSFLAPASQPIDAGPRDVPNPSFPYVAPPAETLQRETADHLARDAHAGDDLEHETEAPVAVPAHASDAVPPHGAASVPAIDTSSGTTIEPGDDATGETVASDVPVDPALGLTSRREPSFSPASPSNLDLMRTAVAAIDGQLAIVLNALRHLDQPETAAIAPAAPQLRRALAALDQAVTVGEIGIQAADTHRLAITRMADTTERLSSILDLYARGYLTADDLEERRQALLGWTTTVN